MDRFPYDRTSKWLIEHHGGLLVPLGIPGRVAAWRPAQAEVVQPRRTPDGLLEVRWEGEEAFHPVILEIETYPKNETADDLLKDVLLVWADRGVVADVLVLVLHPKGDVAIATGAARTSHRGLASLAGSWRVVNLWDLPATDLLATGEPGLMPWVSLTRIEGSVEATLRECRRVIDEKGKPDERENLLAVTQVLMALNYNEAGLLDIFGGNKAMIESPLLERIINEKMADATRQAILNVLKARFGAIPPDLGSALAAVADRLRLEQLTDLAVLCPSVEAFRQQLAS